MDLTQIKDPSFLKNYSIDQLNTLCQEIRDFLIASVSKTGGHLSSNLGTVELSIALHKVFNSGEDKFLFDVGHQSYTHKILTGRAGQFCTLRQTGGLSGFQKMAESEHDPFEAGHAGTALSTALGIATANSLNHVKGNVIAIVGDGSLTNGMCYEALNNIGSSNQKVIIIINDNDMSISKNVGSISKAFAQLSVSKPYIGFKEEVTDLLKKGGVLTKPLALGMRTIKETVKKNVVSDNIFQDFGLKYLGVYDGHNLKDMIKVFEYAKKYSGPIVVHLKTIKGKGYSPSEVDHQGIWHGVSQFDPNTGESCSCLPEGVLSYSSIISETLIRLAKDNLDICCITPAMVVGSKLEKFFKMFPKRSFDTGITEEHAMTFAAGLALGGKQPFISIYSTFLQRAYDQLNHDVSRMNLPVVIGIDRAGIVGEDGDTHQGLFDIGFCRPLPNLILTHPKNGEEAQHLLYTAFKSKKPFAIRYARGNAQYIPVAEFKEIEIGTWELIECHSEPKSIIFTYGQEVDNLAQKARVNHYPWWVVNMRFIKPIDKKMISQLTKKQNVSFVIVESDYQMGGVSQDILSYLNESSIHCPIHCIGLTNQYIEHGSMSLLRQKVKIDTNSIVESILKYQENS